MTASWSMVACWSGSHTKVNRSWAGVGGSASSRAIARFRVQPANTARPTAHAYNGISRYLLETCSLEWRAIDLDGDAPSVSVTSSKTKAGLRTLPLPKASAEILRELRGGAAKGANFVFPAEPGAKRAKHMHAESLSRAFARACARLEIAGASTHDLRRTCLSGLMELGHDTVAERIAGHVPRHVLGRHYDRSSRLDAMRAGLEEWAQAIDAARVRSSEETP